LPFRTVHQTLECWFQAMIEILDFGAAQLAERSWAGAATTTSYLADILYFLAVQIRLLDYMDMADYHPLRVVLKSASGAQSESAARVIAAVRRQYELFAAQMPSGRSIARVFERPADHAAEYLYIDALGRLESAFADFLHSHYYRALRVQSRRGLGSLGKGVDGLLERALKPLYPALDQARFEHLLFNNWQFAPVQGTLIEELTGTAARSAGAAALDAAGRQRAVERVDALVAAFHRGDLVACAALFAPRDGCVWDVRGTRAYHGVGEIRGYFESVFQSLTITGARAVATEWIGDRLIKRLVVDVVAFTGNTASLEITWELEFGEQLDIRSLVADWDTARVAQLVMSGPSE
jgi:hypothetical protein